MNNNRVIKYIKTKTWIYILFIVLFPIIIHGPLFIFKLKTDPIWFSSTAVNIKTPGFFDGLPYGDPNVGWTTEALGHLAASDWMKGKIPWWNPYSGIGLPLAGEMQPGAFFLPFILLLLLHNGIFLLKIVLQILSGVFTFFLLRELGLGRLSSLAGGLLFSINGTFSWTPGPQAVIYSIPFLPLLLLGIEFTYKFEKRIFGIFLISFSIAWLIFSGFPEVAYIDGLLALVWALYRIINSSNRKKIVLRIIYGGFIGIMISSPLLFAFFQYLFTSSAMVTHLYGNISAPLIVLPPFFMPYIYAPLTESYGNSVLSGVWGDLGGYVGVVILFIAMLGLTSQRERGLRILLIVWVLLCWAKTFGLEPFTMLINQIPFLKQTAFFRYSCASWELSLIILASFAIDDLKYKKPYTLIPLIIIVAIVGFSIFVAWPWSFYWNWPHQSPVSVKVRNYFLFSIFLAIFFIILSRLLLFLQGEKKRILLVFLLIVESSFYFVFPELIGVRSGTLDQPAIQFLKNNLGLSRFYTLGPIEPNYSAYFEIGNINYNSLPIESSWSNFVQKNLFPPLATTAGVDFSPLPPYQEGLGVKYLLKFLPNYESLSVKYIVTKHGQPLFKTFFLKTASSGNTAWVLMSGQTLIDEIKKPLSIGRKKKSLSAIGIMLGNYQNQANGTMVVKVCTKTSCAFGEKSMIHSFDNDYNFVSLNPPLLIGERTKLVVKITNRDGSNPFALWLWPSLPHKNQNIQTLNGAIPKTIPKMGLRLALAYQSPSEKLKKIYTDSIMDIWETPSSKPYFSVHNGPCQFIKVTREKVKINCNQPGVLVRRELNIPGWMAIANKENFPIITYKGIFQSIIVPKGQSSILFSFTPPHIQYAFMLFSVGVIALFFEVTIWFFQFFRRTKGMP